MFHLFQEHGRFPGAYYNLSEGEKVVIRAFAYKEADILKNQGR